MDRTIFETEIHRTFVGYSCGRHQRRIVLCGWGSHVCRGDSLINHFERQIVDPCLALSHYHKPKIDICAFGRYVEYDGIFLPISGARNYPIAHVVEGKFAALTIDPHPKQSVVDVGRSQPAREAYSHATIFISCDGLTQRRPRILLITTIEF